MKDGVDGADGYGEQEDGGQERVAGEGLEFCAQGEFAGDGEGEDGEQELVGGGRGKDPAPKGSEDGL